jgi:type I restriction enzyme S subunit
MLYDHLRNLGFQPCSSEKGPDFRIVHQEQVIWIEAVTPSPEDIPPSYLKPPNKWQVTVGELPDEEPLLRWTAALSAKRARLQSYKKGGIIGENDCTIIAVNSCRLHDWRRNDCGSSGFPFAVEAVFPIGRRAAPVTPEGQPDGATVNIPRYEVRNPKGKLVSTDSFCNPQYANVSALLGCYHKPTVNPDYQKTGKISLTMVHNPLAAVPLPRGILDQEKEYFAEAEGDHYVLRWTIRKT